MAVCDIHGQPISKEWCAEFRGYFMADGCLMFNKYRRKYHTKNGPKYSHLFRVSARIALRGDCKDTLLEIQSRLGGCIFRRNGHNSPSLGGGKVYVSKHTEEWIVTSREALQRVADILKGPLIPYRKAEQLIPFQELISMLHESGQHYTSDEKKRIFALGEQLSSLKAYKVNK